jgi:hypothetical protein
MATLKEAQTLWAPAAEGAGSAAGKMQSAIASSPALPAKLVISATRQMLDDVSTGKLSLEDFKKKATVEYLTFPAAEKAPAKP